MTATDPESVSPPRRRWLRSIVPWIAPAVVLGAYLTLALIELPAHRYQINPDGVSYISIARQYARGQVADAVSAYWSPLYSWLMVPFLWMRLDPLLASKITGIGIGAAGVLALMHLLAVVRARVEVRTLIALSAIPLIVNAVYSVTTPDLLVGVVLLFYLASLCAPTAPGWARGARIGAWGGLAYLAKAYALPLVLVHWVVVRSLGWFRRGTDRRRSLPGSVAALLTMGVIVASWSAVLTHKHGFVTTGTTGTYNLRIDARESPGQVMHFAGFLPPPGPHSISAWDDITPHLDRLPRWNRLETQADRAFLIEQVQRNYRNLARLLERVNPSFWWIFGAVLLVAGSRADGRPFRPGVVLSAALVLYPLGYLLLHIEERFLVPLVLMLLAGAGYVIARAAARGLLRGWMRSGLAALLIGAMFINQPLNALEKTRGAGQDIAQQAERLHGVIPPGSRIASDGRWAHALYLAHYLDLRYFGEPAPRTPLAQMLLQLDEHQVDHLVLWRKRPRITPEMGWEEIALEVEKPFKLYRRMGGGDNLPDAAH